MPVTTKRKLFCPLCGKFLVAVENQGEAVVYPCCNGCGVEYEFKYPMSSSGSARPYIVILLDPKLTDEAKKLAGT